MAYKADTSTSANNIVVDGVATPAGDVQAVKLWDGTAGSMQPVVADSAGALSVKERRPATAAHTNVTSSASSVTVVSSNTSRLGVAIFNDSTATLYISLSSAASTTNYLVQIGASQYYELPFGWTGLVNGIWSAANGFARVTEFS